MAEDLQADVVKWYTRARKFPQLIGRTPDGTRIWGGPYTVTQAIGAGVILFVGLNTMWLWANFGLVMNLVILFGVTYTAILLLGRIPVGSRSPLAVTAGLLRAGLAPATGHLGGRSVRIRRPHLLQHRLVVAIDPHLPEPTVPLEESVTADAPAPPVPTPATPPPRPPMTGVQALLAGKGLDHDRENQT